MSLKEYKEQSSQNRNTLYHFFKDNGLDMKSLKIGKGVYKVFQVPYTWDSAYLIINEVRITDFHSVIIFSNELVVRMNQYSEMQINIPYRIIETIKVTNDLNVGYEELHLNKK